MIPLQVMKHHVIVLLYIAFGLWAQGQEVDTTAYFDPAQVMTEEVDSAEINHLAACQMVAGEWQYSKPYVHAEGSSFIGKLGKPIAKSKLKKGLNKVYKKLKINKRWSSLTLTTDGSWEMRIAGLPIKGRYSYNPDEQQLTLRWNGIPLKSHTHRDGNRLYIAFDTDRLLVILHLISGMSHSQTLKALSTLSQNYRNVMVGFEMNPLKNR